MSAAESPWSGLLDVTMEETPLRLPSPGVQPDPLPGRLPPVTDELLAAMEFRYAVPRCCRVCGAPLSVADSHGMKMTCTSDAASPLKNPLSSSTWKAALDHYQNSVMYDPPPGDVHVLALVAEVRRLRGGQ